MIPLWEKPLASLSDHEWEQLCDGCGQCCLVKLQDDDTDEIFATDVVCRFLNTDSGHCSVYASRAIEKPECFIIERDNVEHFSWLPKSCAYRLRFEDKPLPSWHPLLSGSRDAMNAAEISVAGWSVSEQDVGEEELPERVIFTLHEPS